VLPAGWRDWAFVVDAALRKVVSGYLRGQLLVALLLGVSAGVGCWLIGVPFPVVIGVVVGVLELVPMIGPFLGAIVAVLVSIPQGWTQVLWVVLLFLAIHQIELNILAPRIAGHAVGIHPAVALVSLLLGFELGGFVGALIAVPTAGLLYVLAMAVYWEWSGQAAPELPRRPDRLLGLARDLVHRQGWAGPWPRRPDPPATEPTSERPAATIAVTSVAVQGATAAQPESLAKVAQHAQQLHVEFEESERVRLAADQESGAGDDPPAGAAGQSAGPGAHHR
jgi:hypothetical protein